MHEKKKEVLKLSRIFIARKLKELREKTGLTADEVGALVEKSGKTVNAWENNRGQPDAEILIKLCDIYHVDNILAEFRQDKADDEMDIDVATQEKLDILVKKYRSLDEHGTEVVDIVLDKEYKRWEQEQIKEESMQDFCKLYSFDMPVSAGNGFYLEEEYKTYIEIPKEQAKGADYVFRVNGDSMLPTYKDGDKVLVKKGQVNIGEVGVFVVENEGYIKELGNGCLLSYNKEYNDIPLHEFDNMVMVGKVIGKL